MIEIIDTVDLVEQQIDVGDDLPLKIVLGVKIENIDNIFTWRCTNSRKLIEIKINSNNGRLLEINFILIPNEKIKNTKSVQSVLCKNHIIGLPIVDLNYWYRDLVSREIGIDLLDRTIDEDLDFIIEVDKHNLHLQFLPESDVDCIIEFGRIQFFLNSDKKLCAIAVKGISIKKLLKIILE